MPLVTITIDDNAAAVAAKYSRARPAILGAIRRGLDAGNVEAVAHIKNDKLTAAGPKYLNVRSGRLRRSARATLATISGAKVTSSVGSNVSYAAAHERGAKAHKVVASGKALRFQPVGRGVFRRGQGFIFRKSAMIPALPARRPFGDGIDDKVNDGTYSRLISREILSEFGR